jgi:hypothetical protein
MAEAFGWTEAAALIFKSGAIRTARMPGAAFTAPLTTVAATSARLTPGEVWRLFASAATPPASTATPGDMTAGVFGWTVAAAQTFKLAVDAEIEIRINMGIGTRIVTEIGIAIGTGTEIALGRRS